MIRNLKLPSLAALAALMTAPALAADPAGPDAGCFAAPTVDCLFIAAYHAAAEVPEAVRRPVIVDILGQQLVAGIAGVPREVVGQANLSDDELTEIMRAQLGAGDGPGALASVARIADPAKRAAAHGAAGVSLLARGDRENAKAALDALMENKGPEGAVDGAIVAAGLGDGDAADDLLDRIDEPGRAEEARHGVARRLAEQDRADDALEVAEEIRFTPGRDATLAAIADVRMARADLDGAVDALDEVKDPALARGEKARLIPALLEAGRFDDAKELIDGLESGQQQAALTRWLAARAAKGDAEAIGLLSERADAALHLRTPAERFEALLPLVGAYGRMGQRDRALALGTVALNAAEALEPAPAARAIRRLFAEQAESGERIGLEATLKSLASRDDDAVATLMAQISAGLTLVGAGDRPGGAALLTAAGALVERLPLTERSIVLARLSAARLEIGDREGARAALIKGRGHLDAMRSGEPKAIATLKLAEAAADLKESAAPTLAAAAATVAANSNWRARGLILGGALPILFDAAALEPLMAVHAALPAAEQPRVLPAIFALLRREAEAGRLDNALAVAGRLPDPADQAAALTVLAVTESRAGRPAAAARLVAGRTDPAERATMLAAMAVALSGR